MKKDNIELPPLPKGDIASDTCPIMWVHTEQQSEIYGREEVEVYRQKLAEELHEKYTQAYPYPEGLQKETIDEKGLKLGQLITVNQDNYPALGSLFVQIWKGDSVVARVYGDSKEEVLTRANFLLGIYVTNNKGTHERWNYNRRF